VAVIAKIHAGVLISP